MFIRLRLWLAHHHLRMVIEEMNSVEEDIQECKHYDELELLADLRDYLLRLNIKRNQIAAQIRHLRGKVKLA